MPDQIVGLYIECKETLLKEFDHTAVLMKDSLVTRFGKEFASRLKTGARQEYEKLIPEIPYIQGIRGRSLAVHTPFNRRLSVRGEAKSWLEIDQGRGRIKC